MRIGSYILFLLLIPSVACSQVYDLSWKADVPLAAGGLGLTVGSGALATQVDPLTPAELAILNPADINGFDRFATDNWSPQIAHASDATLIIAGVSPLVTLLSPKSRSEFGPIAVMYAEGLFLTFGATNLTKALSLRARPFTYNTLAPLQEQTKVDARFSFFSGHTSLTTFGAFFTAKVLHDTHPGAKWRPYVWGGAAALSVGTAYMRVAAGKHYPTDVLVGLGIGAGIAYLVPELHRRKGAAQGLSVFPTGNGLALNYRF